MTKLKDIKTIKDIFFYHLAVMHVEFIYSVSALKQILKADQFWFP